jgi:hypothetical protein
MRLYHPTSGTILRHEYGVLLGAGLARYPQTTALAPDFIQLNDDLLTAHTARVALRKPLLLARANLRFVELDVDRCIRAAYRATQTADGGRRSAGPIASALFPEKLKPVIAPKGKKQLQPTIDLIDRLVRAKVPGIDAYRKEWLPKLQNAQKELEAAIAQYDAATAAHTVAFKDEKALRDQHYNEVDRIMGLVRAAFPRDKEMQDIIFPPADDRSTATADDGSADDADQPDEPEDPPEPVKASSPSAPSA